jgi:uncharacterized protein (DUF305 family)
MMKRSIVSVAAALALFGMAAPASAQQTQSQGASSSMAGHSDMAAGSQALPEQCRAAGANMPQSQGMDMPGMSMQGTTDAQKAYMEAMMKMHPPMMTAIQAKDPDVAFICGMLPHHQGAIDMARAELKYGDNPEAKRMAEKVIKDQGEEIEKMTAWLKKNVKKDGQ